MECGAEVRTWGRPLGERRGEAKTQPQGATVAPNMIVIDNSSLDDQ
jgi:hypothetical protein